jgi:hypothetical protein
MAFEFLKDVDTTWLDQILLDRDRLVRPVKWKKLRNVPHNDIKVWCVRNGVYQIPTQELIEWLRSAINGRSAIEICSGRSCLGRPLGIPMIDSFLHGDPSMNRVYQMFGQTPTVPPDDVERITSNEAVIKYKPKIVIGAWVTELGDGADGKSNPGGTDEEAILDTGAIYIHIGNAKPHGDKRIMQRRHLEFSFPWLTGRGLDKSLNRIWVWNAKE